MNLDCVRLLVDNFDECFLFYRDIMGFSPTWGDVGYIFASFDAGGMKLSIFKKVKQAEALGTGALPSETEAQDRAAVIFRSENVDEEVKTLKIRGATMLLEPKDYENWGIRAAYLRDPAGNLIEINSSMPKEKWSEVLRDEAARFER